MSTKGYLIPIQHPEEYEVRAVYGFERTHHTIAYFEPTGNFFERSYFEAFRLQIQSKFIYYHGDIAHYAFYFLLPNSVLHLWPATT